MRRLGSALGATALVLASQLAPAGAQSAGITREQPRQLGSPAAVGAPHRLFGSLQGVSGSTLTLLLRTGRLVRVDATRAFALRRVAAPLYRGKPIVVDGTITPNGTFAAVAVKRGASQPSGWGSDY